MQIANDFWNQQTYGDSRVQNKSQSATDFADVFKNFSCAGVGELSGDALFSGITVVGNKTISASVYYSKNYSPDNPVYAVKGVNIDGTRFEKEINVNDVDPRNANHIEMQALRAHLIANGKMSDIGAMMNPFSGVFGSSYTNPDAFTKADWLAPMGQMMEWQRANNNLEGYNRFMDIIDALMEHIQKSKDQVLFEHQSRASNPDRETDLASLFLSFRPS